MNPALHKAITAMMFLGANKHASSVTHAAENLIVALDANPPAGYHRAVPHLDLHACRAVAHEHVLRPLGHHTVRSLKVSDIIATSDPAFAGRTPRQCLLDARAQGPLRFWIERFVTEGLESVTGALDRKVEVLLLPDGKGVIQEGGARWVLARLLSPDASFGSASCQHTETDADASAALQDFLEQNPSLRLSRTGVLGEQPQIFYFRGGQDELEVLERGELIARSQRRPSLLRRAARLIGL